MTILKVTPIKNVLIGKRRFKSEQADLFFNKAVCEDIPIEVYDVSDRKRKQLSIAELNRRNHRLIINEKKFFICSIRSGS